MTDKPSCRLLRSWLLVSALCVTFAFVTDRASPQEHDFDTLSDRLKKDKEERLREEKRQEVIKSTVYKASSDISKGLLEVQPGSLEEEYIKKNYPKLSQDDRIKFTNYFAQHAYENEYFKPTVAPHFFLPITERQFHNVYGVAATRSDIRKMRQSADYVNAKFQVDHADTVASASTIKYLIGSSPASVVMLVGHSTNNELVFLDGSRVSIGNLLNIAAETHKRVAIVSCNAKDALTGYPNSNLATATETAITFDQAVDIAEYVTTEIKKYVLRYDGTNMMVLDALMGTAEAKSGSRARTKRVVKVVVSATGTVVVAVVIIIALDCVDHPEKSCLSVDGLTPRHKKE